MKVHVVIALSLLYCTCRSYCAPLVKASGVQWSEPKGAGKGNITLIMIPQNSSAGNDSDMIVAVKSDYQILSQDTQLLNLIVSENKDDTDNEQKNECKNDKNNCQGISNVKEENVKKAPDESENVKTPNTAKYFEPEKKHPLDKTNKSVDIYPVLLKNYQNLLSGNETTPRVSYSSVNVLQLLGVNENNNPLLSSNEKNDVNILHANETGPDITNNFTDINERNSQDKNESAVDERNPEGITIPSINSNNNFLSEALNILEKLKQNPSYYDTSKVNQMTSIEETKNHVERPYVDSKTKFLKMDDPALVPDGGENQVKDMESMVVNSNDVANLQEEAVGNINNSNATSCIPFFISFTNEPSTAKLIDLKFQQGVALESVPINPNGHEGNEVNHNINNVDKLEKTSNFENESSISKDKLFLVSPGQALGESNLFQTSTACVLPVSGLELAYNTPQYAKAEPSSLLTLLSESSTLASGFYNQTNSGAQGQFESMPLSNETLSSNITLATAISLSSNSNLTECITLNSLNQETRESQQPKLEQNDVLLSKIETPSPIEKLNPSLASPQQVKVDLSDFKTTTDCPPVSSFNNNLVLPANIPQQANVQTSFLELNITTINLNQTITADIMQYKTDLVQTTECATIPISNQPTMVPQSEQTILQAISISNQPAMVPQSEQTLLQAMSISNQPTMVPQSEQTTLQPISISNQPTMVPQSEKPILQANLFEVRANVAAGNSNFIVANSSDNAGNGFAGVITACPTFPGPAMQNSNNLQPGVGSVPVPKKITLEPPANCLTLLQGTIAVVDTATSGNIQQRQEEHPKEKDLMLPLVESSVFLANNNEISKGKDIPISLNALNASLDELGVLDLQDQDDKMHDKVVYLYNDNNQHLVLNEDDGLNSGAYLKPVMTNERKFVKNKPLLNRDRIHPDINNILKMHFIGKNNGLERKLAYRIEKDGINCKKTGESNNSIANSDRESDDYENHESSLSSTGAQGKSKQIYMNQQLNATSKQTDFRLTTEADGDLLTILNRLETTSSQEGVTEDDQLETRQATTTGLEETSAKSSFTSQNPGYEDNSQTTTAVINYEYPQKEVSSKITKSTTLKNNVLPTKRTQCSKTTLKTQCTKSVTAIRNNAYLKENISKYPTKSKNNDIQQMENKEQKMFIPGNSVQKIIIEIVTNDTKKTDREPEKFKVHQYLDMDGEKENEQQDIVQFRKQASNVKQKECASLGDRVSQVRQDDGSSSNVENVYPIMSKKQLYPLMLDQKNGANNNFDCEPGIQYKFVDDVDKKLSEPIYREIFMSGEKNVPIYGDTSSGENVPVLVDTNSGENVPNHGDTNSGENVPNHGDTNSGENVPVLVDTNSGENVPNHGDTNSGENVPVLVDTNSGEHIPNHGDTNSGEIVANMNLIDEPKIDHFS